MMRFLGGAQTSATQTQASAADNFTRTDLLWLLGSVCQLHRLPFDPVLIERQFPPPCTKITLFTALSALGFKTGVLQLPAGTELPSNLPLPAIGYLRPESEEPTEADTVARDEASARPCCLLKPILLVKTDGERILYFRAGSQVPETATREEMAARFSPEITLLARDRAAPVAAGDEAAGAFPAGGGHASRFGFRWFIPELLKHKRIWRDVVLASLIMQLIGLTTPLFTQVVIDKVVVHQTLSTLGVIAAGMFLFMIFNSIMTWLRQYLVLHTGNRIDAVLGSQVFRHLLRLAPALFRAPPYRHARRPPPGGREYPTVREWRRRHPGARFSVSPDLSCGHVLVQLAALPHRAR